MEKAQVEISLSKKKYEDDGLIEVLSNEELKSKQMGGEVISMTTKWKKKEDEFADVRSRNLSDITWVKMKDVSKHGAQSFEHDNVFELYNGHWQNPSKSKTLYFVFVQMGPYRLNFKGNSLIYHLILLSCDSRLESLPTESLVD
ncbi:hypothetical protein L1887_12579 [Cichorium endivia]|nr:hypothetical protein L1887_12579 [Cichorium endivia]